MSDLDVFGPLVDERDVQHAVRDTIKLWITTYLAVIERKRGLEPKSLPLPRSYVLRDDGTLDKRPEDQLPSIVILCPGTAGDPVPDGEGLYRAPFAVSVTAIVSARDHDSTSDLAKYYAAAIRALFVHQASLGGFAQTTVWKGTRNDDLRPEDDRTLAAGTNVFQVYVTDIVRRGAGLKAPPEDPYEEIDWPTVAEVDVELEPEEIT